MHEFVVMRRGVLEKYTQYEDIPLDFEHLIKFNPHIPPEPHTKDQHEEIESWFFKFKALIENRKNNCSTHK